MECWHLSGAGNDFVVIDARNQIMDMETFAKELCAKTGADGFLAVDHSDVADFRLHFYNPDGLRGEMCGNGCRCVCRFAYDNGIAGEHMVVQTDAGLVPVVRMAADQYRVELNVPGVVDLDRKESISYVELGNPGIPHAVVRVPGLTFDMREALLPLARSLRYDSAFPKGVNVNFYDVLDHTRVRVLTYERGVEDYTLACGTGSGSVAVILWLQGALSSDVLLAENQGGTLKITIEGQNKQVEKLILEGPAEIIKKFEI